MPVETDTELRDVVQLAICKMNREQDRDAGCIWVELENALLAVGEALGCNLDARGTNRTQKGNRS